MKFYEVEPPLVITDEQSSEISRCIENAMKHNALVNEKNVDERKQ